MKDMDFCVESGATKHLIRLKLSDEILPPSKYAARFCEILLSRDLKGKSVLDVGTGSGVLAIAAGLAGASVNVTDINPDAVSIAEKNLALNGLNCGAAFVSDAVDFFQPKTIDEAELFDVIVFNHPSLPFAEANERPTQNYIRWNQNGSGRRLLDAILENGAQYLKPGGFLLTHSSSEQHWDITVQKLSSRWPDWRVLIAEEMEASGDYYDWIKDFWLAEGKLYIKGGKTLHDVRFVEAYKERRPSFCWEFDCLVPKE